MPVPVSPRKPGILAGDRGGNVKRVFLMENAEHSSSFYVMDSGNSFRYLTKWNGMDWSL